MSLSQAPSPVRLQGDPGPRPLTHARGLVAVMTPSDQDFVAFVDEIGADLRRTAKRLAPPSLEADDLAAEALARAYAHWEKVGSMPYRRAWVFRVLSNLAFSARSSGRRHALSLRRWNLDETASTQTGGDSTEGEATDSVMLSSLLRSLPGRQRAAIALHYIADLTLEETAQVMGVGTETVKTHIRRGLDSLRRALGSEPEGMLHA